MCTQIQWFWRALRSFDQADRARFLQFVTGTSKVPLQGFAALEGMNGVQKFQIHRDDRSTDRLPCAHTWWVNGLSFILVHSAWLMSPLHHAPYTYSVLSTSSGTPLIRTLAYFMSILLVKNVKLMPMCFPSSFNQLDLPPYETYDKLKQMLLLAVRECPEGFGFA